MLRFSASERDLPETWKAACVTWAAGWTRTGLSAQNAARPVVAGAE
jgi:hypothetical protein